MANNFANINMSSNANSTFTNETIDDLILWTTTSNQAIHLGSKLGSNAAVKIGFSNTSNYVNVNGNLSASNINFTGSLLQNGSAYIGSQWITNTSNVYISGSNVGIGTSTPQGSLHVKTASVYGLTLDGSTNTDGRMVIAKNVGTNNASVQYTQGGNTVSQCYAETGLLGDNNFHIKTGVAGSLTDRIVIGSNNGFVGIGTSNPSTLLTVNGNITLGTLSADCFITTPGQMNIWSCSTGNASFFHMTYAVGAPASANGDHIWFTKGSSTTGIERMRITANGNFIAPTNSIGAMIVGGTAAYTTGSAPSGVMQIYAAPSARSALSLISDTTATNQGVLTFHNQNGTQGQVQVNTTGTVYVTSSDYRLKTNQVGLSNALALVDKLNPCTYEFKSDLSKVVSGFFAHELQEFIPEAVSGIKDEVDEKGNPIYQGVDYGRISPWLVAAIKELTQKVNTLTERVTQLENK